MVMAGQQAVEYFSSLPVGALEGAQEAQPLQEGSNEAEWIVDITTQADRQGRYALQAALICTLLPAARICKRRDCLQHEQQML